MDSENLASLGFTHPIPCEGLPISSLPQLTGVYSFILGRPQPLVRGISNIVYIGKATNRNGLRLRIRQYWHPGSTQRTNIKVKDLIKATQDVSLAYKVIDSVDEARQLEADLLRQFRDEHLQLPPWNVSQPLLLDLRGKIDLDLTLQELERLRSEP